MAPFANRPYQNLSTSNITSKSSSSDTITNTVFGLCAIAIGVLTVWQGRRVWRLWYTSRVPAADRNSYCLSRSSNAYHADRLASNRNGNTPAVLSLDGSHPPTSTGDDPFHSTLNEPQPILEAYDGLALRNRSPEPFMPVIHPNIPNLMQHQDDRTTPHILALGTQDSSQIIQPREVEQNQSTRTTLTRRYSAPSILRHRATPEAPNAVAGTKEPRD